MKEKTLWETYTPKQRKEMETVCRQYMDCMDEAKTEREAVRLTVKMAEAAGYRPLEEAIKSERKLAAGDKVYTAYNEKLVVLYHMGEKSMEEGMNILGAHIDSPRLDVKQNPLYEAEGFAYLDTHYYGGIKKYQWVTIPLAIHGVVAKKDGTVVEVNVGEADSDPVFTITDILPHLGFPVSRVGNRTSRQGKGIGTGQKHDFGLWSRR